MFYLLSPATGECLSLIRWTLPNGLQKANRKLNPILVVTVDMDVCITNNNFIGGYKND